jgi:4-amino-4-deoxy-L-arabinose transferase-like glycosyltransferase
MAGYKPTLLGARLMMPPMLRKAVVAAIAVRAILIALVARLGGPQPFRVGDSFSYVPLAESLARTGRFLDRQGMPELFRTPGYPSLLVPGVLLGVPDAFAIAMNVVLAVAVVIVTYRIAQRVLRDERAAGLCALLVAIEPTMLTWSLKVMPETLFTLCLLLFAYAAIEDKPVAAGIAICAAAYVKPIAYPLVFVILIAALFVRRKYALALIATCVVLLAPWHLRNYSVGRYAGFSTVVERSVYLSAGGSVAARQEGLPYEQERLKLIEREKARAGDPSRYARMRREGASRVASDPLGWAVTHGKGMLRTLFDPGAVEYPRMLGFYAEGGRAVMSSGGVVAVVRAYPVLFLLSAFFGIVLLPLIVLPFIAATRIPREALFAFCLFALIAAYLVFAGGGIPGYHRMRVPAVPFLVLMSAFVYTARTCSSPRSPSASTPPPSP